MNGPLIVPLSASELGVHQNSLLPNPTAEINAEWQYAYDHFNAALFASNLPPCFMTFTQGASSMGHFCASAVCNKRGVHAHEIAINLDWIAALGVAEGYSTLVHEMTHLKRHLDGRPNRKGGSGSTGYHDIVWADLMESVGLVPSSTGKPGGKRTGYRMMEYSIEGGPFDIACRELLISDNSLNWRGALLSRATTTPGGSSTGAAGTMPQGAPTSGKRARFICEGCGVKAWSRPSAHLSCTDCNRLLSRT